MHNPTEEKIKDVLGGLKTQAFFENMYRPHDSNAVTVDLWMIRWAKKLKLIPEKGGLTPKRYGIVAKRIEDVARKQNLLPHQYQALAWVELRGNKY